MNNTNNITDDNIKEKENDENLIQESTFDNIDSYIHSLWNRRNRMQCFTN